MKGQHNQPIITVIMAVFNSEKFLKDAIESVLKQTFEDWELICVNDGSTDNSLEILKGYEALDTRIIVLNQKNSGTASAARNKALDNAKGKFIQMLDSDDLLGENCLEKTHEVALRTGADFVIPDLVCFKNTPQNITFRMIGYNGDRKLIISPKEAFIATLTWKISGVGLYRTELLKKFGYDETGLNSDEYTTRLLLLNCNKIAFCNSAYFYRKHPNSTTNKVSRKRFDTLLTDFRILDLSYEYQMGDEAVRLSKSRIVKNIIFSEQFYLAVRKNFRNSRRIEIQNLIMENFKKIDKSFIVFDGNVLSYLIRKVIFIDFRILKIYSFFIVCIKYILNRKY